MGTHLELQDHDAIFRNLTTKPIIVNKLLDTLEKEKNAFDANFFVTYTDTDLLDTIPKCPCGHTQGQHHINNSGRGTVCVKCKQEVQPMLDKPLEPIIWVQSPEKVDRFINPQAWRLLSNFYSLSNSNNQKFNLIKYLANTDYHPNRNHHGRWMDELERLGVERGLNFFHRKFDEIIDVISGFSQFSANKDKKEKLREMLIFINMYRDRIFSEYLPVHNKTILVIENTKFGTYMDTTLKTIIDAVRNISGVDSPIKDYSVRQKENHAAKLTEALAIFGPDYEKNFLSGKPGHIRKHVYATRCWFSFRGVIYSITRPHHHDEIIMPWAMAITVFRIHLLGMLYHRGFGHNDAGYFLNEHTHCHHPLLEELLNEMIAGSPYELSPTIEASIVGGKLVPTELDGGILDVRDMPVIPKDGLDPNSRLHPARKGIPIVIGRNPSMYRTSIQRMFITGFTTDPSIYSIGYPITSVTGPNADFDGDQMFGFLTLDNWTTDELRYLAPHFGAWKLDGPRSIGNNMPLPKPLVTSLVNHLYNYSEEDRKPDPRKRQLMEQMFSIKEHKWE